jgi:hypothetical protein
MKSGNLDTIVEVILLIGFDEALVYSERDSAIYVVLISNQMHCKY